MSRDRKNLSQPFRMTYNGKNEYAYKMIRITKLPELNSTFMGLIGEDISGQIISGVVKNRTHAPEKESPIEKIIKY